jgi:5-aminopentanamidase
VSITRVACAQIAPLVGDTRFNRRVTRDAIREAVSGGARLIVLPELATSGYAFESLEEARATAQPPDGPALSDWATEAARGDAVVVGGFCELGDDDTLYNSAAIVDATGTIAVYRKVHLWGEEKRVFGPGDICSPVFETRVGRVGVGICYDVYFAEVTRGLALQGADIIALPTNAPRRMPADGGVARPPAAGGYLSPIQISIYVATAHINHVFFAACDRCGDERGIEWVGASLISDETGWVLAGPPPGYGPGMLFADCDLERARDKQLGPVNHTLGDRRPELYSAVASPARPAASQREQARADVV